MTANADRLSTTGRAARLAVAALSYLGIADSLYMLAYDKGLIDSLVCPFFGEGCNIVGRSAHATHLGVPNAAAGAVGYAVMGALALWLGDQPSARRPLQALGLAGVATAAAATSAFLTWEQATKARAWCFWCLGSAALNAAILPLALADGLPALRSLRCARRCSMPIEQRM